MIAKYARKANGEMKYSYLSLQPQYRRYTSAQLIDDDTKTELLTGHVVRCSGLILNPEQEKRKTIQKISNGNFFEKMILCKGF